MTYLKSTRSDFYPDIELTELSALQRLQYLEYLSEEESFLQDNNKDMGPAKVSAMNIRISARLVALSLMKTKSPDIDPLDEGSTKDAILELQREILSQWSWEGIAASALLVRQLSSMLPPENKPDESEAAVEEDASAEKR